MFTGVNSMARKKDLKTRNRIILMKAGLNVSTLARLIEKSRPWTSQVLYGKKASPETRQAIAAAVGKSIEYLWPTHRSSKAA